MVLGEGGSKGRHRERRSDRVADLGHDVGSCHVRVSGYEEPRVLGLPRCEMDVVDADSSPWDVRRLVVVTLFAFKIAFFETITLVVELFSASNRKRDFDASGLRIER